jgi:hypothetical protein
MEPSLKYLSLAEIPEGELVRKLMADPHWRSRVIGLHGIPSDVEDHLEVPLQGLPGEPKGDIDILLVPPGRPDFSTVVQVKRVKVGEKTFYKGEPNRLKELGKLCQQANQLAEIGFAQVYGFVFVVVDSRHNNKGHFTYEGSTPTLRKMIDDAVSTAGLTQRVGLAHFEFVQPTDAEPLGPGTKRGNLKRLAVAISQPSQVTTWVQRTIDRTHDHRTGPFSFT